MSLAAQRLVSSRSPSDVVVIGAVRTPLTKGKKGGLKDTLPEEMLVAAFEGLVERTGIKKELVQEIVVGTVLQPSGGANQSRIAQLAAGFPTSAYVSTVNRQCASGLAAVSNIAKSIQAGEIECGIAAGVESMSLYFGPQSLPEKHAKGLLATNKEAADCLIPMGLTSENVADKYSISRERQDAYSALSFAKAEAAQAANLYTEIVPVHTHVVDPTTGASTPVTVTKDDGVRAGTTKEVLAKLRPAFKPEGSTTAGSSSQVSDGAAAVLLTTRGFAAKHGLKVLGKFVGSATVGVEPGIMGVGPAYAIPKVLNRFGLTTGDVDFFEINEAFASQALWCIEELALPAHKVNRVGGAIAIGHPLGATGARQVATAYAEAQRSNDKLFVTSMCVGSGMGMAGLFTSEQ